VVSAAPAAEPVTPALVEAARQEGRLAFYTAMDLPVAEKFAKAFEAKYPGIAVRVERSGAERVFQRIGQEMASNIHSVDVVTTADGAHITVWKREGWLAPYVPEDVAKYYPTQYKDPDGMFAAFRIFLCIIAYNTSLVKKDEAPKSFADLLLPKWKGKIVKAHPGYSGTIMTATFEMVRDIGWGYFEKLAKQNILQVQSAAVPPKKLALGERAVQADGVEYLIFKEKESGKPVEPVYATEGTPLIIGPNGLFKAAPHPNAARLFQSYCFTPECQQVNLNLGGLRSAHPHVKEKAGRTPLSKIKLMKDDAAGVLRDAEKIKAHYVKLFHV
jgi:iron(III) transport system substrate-binding protein